MKSCYYRLNYLLVVFPKIHLMNDDTCRIDDVDLHVKCKLVLGCVCAMYQLVLNLFAVLCFVGEEMYHQKTPLKGVERIRHWHTRILKLRQRLQTISTDA